MQNYSSKLSQNLEKDLPEKETISLTEILTNNGPNISQCQDPNTQSAPRSLNDELNKVGQEEEEEKSKNDKPQFSSRLKKKSTEIFPVDEDARDQILNLNNEFEQRNHKNSFSIDVSMQKPKLSQLFPEILPEKKNQQYCIEINTLDEKNDAPLPLENKQSKKDKTQIDLHQIDPKSNEPNPSESEQRSLTNRRENIEEDNVNRINALPSEDLNVQTRPNANPGNQNTNNVFIEPLEINGTDTALNEASIQLVIAMEVKTRFFRVVLFSIVQVLIFVLLYLSTIGKIQIEALIGLCSIWPIVECYQVRSKISEGDWRNRTRRFKYFLLLDWIYLFLFIVLCAMKINKPNIQPTFIVIPGFINIILYFGPVALPLGHRANQIIFKLALWIQALLIGTKMDGRSQLNWGASFFAVWVVFVVFLVFALFYIVFFGLVVYNTSRGRNVFRNMVPRTQIAGILWYLLVSILSVFYFIMLIGFTSYLDGDDEGMEIMERAALIGLIYTWILLLITVSGGKYFKDFIRGTTEQRLSSARRNNLNMIVSFEVEPAVQPTFYKVISQTYYLPLEENLTKTSKDEIEKLKDHMWKLKNGFMDLFVSNLEKETISRENMRESLEKKPILKKNETPKSLQDLDFSIKIQDENVLLKPERLVSWTLNDLNKIDKTKIFEKEKVVEGDNENLCFICCLKKADAVNLDCGHGGMCIDCAQEAWKKQNNCVTCRKVISKVAKINMVKGLELGKVEYTIKKISRIGRINTLGSNPLTQ